MPVTGHIKFSRVFGDEPVLHRLAGLGKAPRTFANLVQAGFPAGQLDEARLHYARQVATPVERYAAGRMAQGIFEDESLLQVLCRYYECTDWRLENSPWFLAREDYRRFYGALLSPVEFHVAQLELGAGEAAWGGYFLKLPFDLGMDQAKRALWEEICRRDYYWKPQADYGHLRAANLFRHLRRSVNPVDFSKDQFNYTWERGFRRRFQAALDAFTETLEASVRQWQERRRARTARRFRFRDFSVTGAPLLTSDLLQAMACLGLRPAATNPQAVKRAFRRLSKQTHPDQGGAPEEFKRLTASKELVEAWLHRTPRR